MKVKISSRLNPAAKDTVIILVPEKLKAEDVPVEIRGIIDDSDISYFSGKRNETAHILNKGNACVIVSSYGSESDLNAEALRCAASAAYKTAVKLKRSRLVLIIPSITAIETDIVISSLLEGFLLSDYTFSKYFFKKEKPFAPSELIIISEHPAAKRIAERISLICGNVLFCRDLVNDTSDASNPERMAGYAVKIARKLRLKSTVFDRKKIDKLGMELLSAVGRGSTSGPFLVILSYKGNPRSSESIALVGKGITFDSGGLNLKSSGHIEEMRADMAGAAAVLCAIKTAAELKLEINVHAVMPFTENMIGNSSYKPGDVFSAYNGTTVEIANTDAEGRLILADAVSYTALKLRPSRIIELSTLTGACIVALGEIYAAAITSGDEMDSIITDASDATGEKVWKLPTDQEFDDDMKSDIADLRNVNPERKAGTIFGGSFIMSFAEKIPFAHLDIAGTSWFSKERGYRPKYATGYGVRLLVEILTNIQS